MRLAFLILAGALMACSPPAAKAPEPAQSDAAAQAADVGKVFSDIAVLPAPARETFYKLNDIAATGDLEALIAFANANPEFNSNFGAEPDHGKYWRTAKKESGVDAAKELAKIISQPFIKLAEGETYVYVWPAVYARDPEAPLSEADKRSFASLGYPLPAKGEPYYGYRLAITETGQVLYFVAGD